MKKHLQLGLSIGLGLLISLGATGQEEAPAASIFPDKNLEKAVRQYVFEKRNNEEPLTAKDVENISTVKAQGMEIADLTGLEHCLSLASLDIARNSVKDLAPISKLMRLQYLDASDNNISNIEPLSGLKGLQYIELSTNSVSNIQPLTNLTNLNSLYLSHNRIADIGPVTGLTKLWSLYLDNNQIENLNGIYYLERLGTLSVKNNDIEDISPLFGLTDLHFLFLENNELTDLGALCKIIHNDATGPKRFSPYLRVYVTGNPLSFTARRQQVENIKNCGTRVFF